MTVEELFGPDVMVPMVSARLVGRAGLSTAGMLGRVLRGRVLRGRVLRGRVLRAGIAVRSACRAGRGGGEGNAGPGRRLVRRAAALRADRQPGGIPPGRRPDRDRRGEMAGPDPRRHRPADRAAEADTRGGRLRSGAAAAQEPLSLLDPPIAFSWWPCSSAEALRLAAAGWCTSPAPTCVAVLAATTPARPASCSPAAVRCSGSAPGRKAWCCGLGRPMASPESPTWSARAAPGEQGTWRRGPAGTRPRAGQAGARSRAGRWL